MSSWRPALTALSQLQTGCLCCKVRGDLVETLDDMLRRRDRGDVTSFTRVVIETSGLADPAPILHTLMTDASHCWPPHTERCCHDGGRGHRRKHARARADVGQAGGARRSSRRDEVGSGPAVQVLDRLAALNSSAPVAVAQHGRIDSRLLDRAVELHQAGMTCTRWSIHMTTTFKPTPLSDRPDPRRGLTLFLETLGRALRRRPPAAQGHREYPGKSRTPRQSSMACSTCFIRSLACVLAEQ